MTRALRIWLMLAAAFIFARLVTSLFVLGNVEIGAELFLSAALVSVVQTAVLEFATRRVRSVVRE